MSRITLREFSKLFSFLLSCSRSTSSTTMSDISSLKKRSRPSKDFRTIWKRFLQSSTSPLLIRWNGMGFVVLCQHFKLFLNRKRHHWKFAAIAIIKFQGAKRYDHLLMAAPCKVIYMSYKSFQIRPSTPVFRNAWIQLKFDKYAYEPLFTIFQLKDFTKDSTEWILSKTPCKLLFHFLLK